MKPSTRALLLLGFSALFAAACLIGLAAQSGRERGPAHVEAANPAQATAAVSIPGGDCSLKDFIPAISCGKDTESSSCCSGLRRAFENKCPCRGLPGIVLGHGGTGLVLADNMMRCGYSEGVDVNGSPVAAVDFVAESLGCFDRKEWCNDLLHNIDIRLSAANKGLLQVADEAKGWVYAAAANGDHARVAATVCKALGYLSVASKSVDMAVSSSKRLGCNAASAASGKVSGCEVTDAAKTPGALRIECTREHVDPLSPIAIFQDRPELCMRAGQHSNKENRLACTFSKLGTVVAGHARSIGAAHIICGTAGINETRINWYDGFQDDFTAYMTRSRLDADGRFMTFSKFRGKLNGTDLLTLEELDIDARKARLDASVESQMEGHGEPGLIQRLHALFGSVYDWDSRR
jgi:hypothetical protein